MTLIEEEGGRAGGSGKRRERGRKDGGRGGCGSKGAQAGDWRSEPLGGSPPPAPAAALPGSVSISSPVSWMAGIRASSSDSGTNSGWAMKLWMELRDSGLCSPSYRELRNAFTTLICKRREEGRSAVSGRGSEWGNPIWAASNGGMDGVILGEAQPQKPH